MPQQLRVVIAVLVGIAGTVGFVVLGDVNRDEVVEKRATEVAEQVVDEAVQAQVDEAVDNATKPGGTIDDAVGEKVETQVGAVLGLTTTTTPAPTYGPYATVPTTTTTSTTTTTEPPPIVTLPDPLPTIPEVTVP